MLKSVSSVVLCLFALSGGLALGKTHKKTSKRPAPAATSSRRASAAKSSARARTVSRKSTPTAKRGKSTATASAKTRKPEPKARPAVVAHRSTQQAPTPERYREIQQALADKGYYQGPVNGSWGPDSASALQRFQKERNLYESGKLDSLSLIALGLGPKRNLSARSASEARPKDDNRRTEGSERP